MQKGQSLILILVGVIVAVSIAAGAYYLGRQTSPKPQPTPVVSQFPQPTLSPTPDETANWKIHENKDLGFIVKYPNNLYPDACVATGVPVGSMFWDFETTCAESEIAGWRIGIIVHKGYPDLWVKEGEDKFGVTKKLGDIFVDGVKGEKFITKGKIIENTQSGAGSSDGGSSIIIAILKMVNGSPKTYEFVVTDPDYQLTFNQMLTTFKFLK